VRVRVRVQLMCNIFPSRPVELHTGATGWVSASAVQPLDTLQNATSAAIRQQITSMGKPNVLFENIHTCTA
jgi:hypothetical protein